MPEGLEILGIGYLKQTSNEKDMIEMRLSSQHRIRSTLHCLELDVGVILKLEVELMLTGSEIRESHTKRTDPIVYVPKKHGSLGVYVDNIAVNAVATWDT